MCSDGTSRNLRRKFAQTAGTGQVMFAHVSRQCVVAERAANEGDALVASPN